MAKQNRREFLKIAGSAAAAAILPFSVSSCQQGRKFITPELVSTDIFIPSPQPGIAMLAASFYTGSDDHTLMSVHSKISRADTIDIAFLRRSEDNGRTWSEATEWPTKFDAPNGTGRRHHCGWWTDPKNGRCVMIWLEGVLPNDHPLEGMENWTMRYSVSDDAGKTWLFNEQIIHEGPEYNAIHHFPDITVGKNCLMMGSLSQRPILRSDGAILIPVQPSPPGPDGRYHNPGGGYTWTDCMLLIGRWKPDGRISWTASERIKGDINRTTRGMIEPVLAELDDGTLLMIMRGSNDVKPEWPGYRWMSRSHDGGLTWTTPEPWTYSNGESFFSPSSCSQLLRYSDGRWFWIGNITPENPRGNSPRYPLVMGEVDSKSGLLKKETVTVLDTRRAGESSKMGLSNFYVREDRQTHELLVHVTRMFTDPVNEEKQVDITAAASLLRIKMS